MGFMHLRKTETQQQQLANNSNNNNSTNGSVTTTMATTATTSSGCNMPHQQHQHHDVTAPTLSSINKQTKTYNNTLISSTSNVATTVANESKIPIVRATAALIDVASAATAAAVGGIGSTATIPPSRSGNSRMPHHHMTLRGRSRIRYHRPAGVPAMQPPCTTVTARYFRDVSSMPTVAGAAPLDADNGGMASVRSASATLDLNSNPLQGTVGDSTALPHNKLSQSTSLPKSHLYHHRHPHHGNSANKNNNNNNNNVELNENLRSTPPLDTNRLSSNTNCGRGSFDAVITTATTHTSPIGVSSGITKRNKRSLSSTRLEKDKCDEYNTKLLRKAAGNNNTTQSNNNTSNNIGTNGSNNNNNNNNDSNPLNDRNRGGASTGASATATAGGSYRTRHHLPTAVTAANNAMLESPTASSASSTSTSGIPTPTAASTAHGLYIQRNSGARYAAAAALAVERERETALKLRKKISY